MTYISALLVIFIGVIAYDIKGSKNGKSLWYVFEWFILVLIAGFRYKVGGDTYAMMDYYTYQPELSQLNASHFVDSRYPPLWIIFVSTIKSFSNEFWVFQLVNAIIVNTAFFLFFKKHCKYYYTCVCFYAVLLFLNYNTEIMRAALSVSIFLFAYDYLINKKWALYVLFIIIASGFHAESFLLLLFPFCHLVKNISFNGSIVVLTFLFLLLTSLDFIPAIRDMLSFNEAIQHSFDVHSEGQIFSFNFNGIISYSFKLLTWLFALWIIRGDTSYNKLYVYIAFISVAYSYKYPVIFGRMMDFIYPMLTIELANILYAKKHILKYIVLLGVVYSWGMFYFWRVANTYSYAQYFPYTSIFDPYEIPERNIVVYEYHPNL